MMNDENYLKTKTLIKALINNIMAPPPDLTVSQWADKYRRLSSESSAEPGQWRTDRAPYQREILDSVNDPTLEKVIIMSSAQVGKTELLLNTVGYHIDYDPAPIMLMQPTETLAKNFSKERLAPMLRDSPTLRGKVADVKSRDGGNTVLQKSFAGGYIALVGANAPSGLASRPIRILLADEVDRFPASAGTEGDPIALAEKRTNNFYNRKKVFVSTPTDEETSRIYKEFLGSTQEYYHLPCPNCNEYQPLQWGQIKFDTVTMSCEFCGFHFDEYRWKHQKGKWVAKNPGAKARGFHLNELLSPWKKWLEIIEDFKSAKKNGIETFKVWVNTSLGEVWKQKGAGVKDKMLIDRRETYGCEVPNDVVVLTAGVDVQDNRLEYEIVGWGVGKESWGIKYGVILGDPGQDFVWKELDSVLFDTYERKDGQKLNVSTTCVDSGGHHTKKVYAYCSQREINRVWAIKGKGGEGIPYIRIPKKRNDAGAYLFILGVDVGKDEIVSRLKAPNEQNGYCHFPLEPEKGYNEEYFNGLTAEHKVKNTLKNGQSVFKWELKKSGARNEPFDLRNYASAALEIYNPNLEKLKEFLTGNTEMPTKTPQKRVRKKRRVVSKGIK
ncbi:phage terminase large subunit family protein [Niallia taxi]|uniref:phage terminase large subunit family protein n=1 Tax=Niallia taxi TaxID=2499688 RepID=UPI0021A37F34|nr:phage terminase large subunit family protein [Niallia taxi]MCT2347133.1 phage terminase large subunit family protein [Niallia taxi]